MNPYAGLTDQDAQRAVQSHVPYIEQYLSATKEDPVSFWYRDRAAAIASYQDQFTRLLTDPLNRDAYLWGIRLSAARIQFADYQLSILQSSRLHP